MLSLRFGIYAWIIYSLYWLSTKSFANRCGWVPLKDHSLQTKREARELQVLWRELGHSYQHCTARNQFLPVGDRLVDILYRIESESQDIYRYFVQRCSFWPIEGEIGSITRERLASI